MLYEFLIQVLGSFIGIAIFSAFISPWIDRRRVRYISSALAKYIEKDK